MAEDDVLNYQYFTDFQLMDQQTGHICQYCAFCMKHRSIRQGCWLVHPGGFEKVKTGDLLDRLQTIATGEYETPFAFRITPDPIKSQHAYLWTPLNHATDGFTVSYGKQTVAVDWQEFIEVVDAIEELRYYGFRLDDIRADEPTVKALQKVGRDRYRKLLEYLEQYRGSTLFELAVTASRAKSDQTNKEYIED